MDALDRVGCSFTDRIVIFGIGANDGCLNESSPLMGSQTLIRQRERAEGQTERQRDIMLFAADVIVLACCIV
jgi:hypothetical protein